MLKNLCSKQKTLHSLVFLVGLYGRLAQCYNMRMGESQDYRGPCRPSFPDYPNTEGYPNERMECSREQSRSGLAHVPLPGLSGMHDSAMAKHSPNLMERLISNSREVIQCIMSNSKKGQKDYLRYLADVDLVFVLDNSGSMCLGTDYNSYLNALKLFGEDCGEPVTRHHEMAFVFLCMIHVLRNCGVQSVEVRLLNPVFIGGKQVSNLRINPTNPGGVQLLYSVLLCEPAGTTPLASNLYESIQQAPAGRHRHYVVFTDGQPYVDRWARRTDYEDTVEGLRRLLETYFCPRWVFGFSRMRKLTINFVACTNREEDVEYLNGLDRMSRRIDVTSDLYSEMKQVAGFLGNSGALEVFPPTISAFVYKAMVGCLDHAADSQDESA